MGTEPVVFGRFEGYGSPVEITRGGYVMVKVHHQDEAWQLIETLIKAYPGLPKRGSPYPEGHTIRDGLGNAEFVPPSLQEIAGRWDRDFLRSYAQQRGSMSSVTPMYQGSHIVNGREYAVRRNEYDQLVCDGPSCPVCRPPETRTE